ncbi:MAG: hypothetical protein HKL96_08700 [Phycisphaerales bacterium]|nr:hypothetical protein [Phycisphaerales bacterium]
MARKARYCPGGYIYHVLNRSAGRIALFRRDEDYAAFERVMIDAFEAVPLRIIGWGLMKNHWHFMVWPRTTDEVTGYFRVLAHTHAMRALACGAPVGGMGAFVSGPVQGVSR